MNVKLPRARSAISCSLEGGKTASAIKTGGLSMPTENKKTLKEVYQNIGSALTLSGEDSDPKTKTDQLEATTTEDNNE